LGNFHLILKIRKNTHIQDVIGHFSIQSRNEPKCDVVVLWTGLHLTKVSYDEINKLYKEILEPDDNNIIKVLKIINKKYE